MRPIQNAIEKDELFLAYQPQVSAASGRIVAVETLVRWDHPERGTISPTKFVTAAEKSGEIDALGAWVMRRACADARNWPTLTTAINVSPRQFCQPDFVNLVFEALASSGLEAGKLEIEITESAYFEDPDRAIGEIEELRARGIRVSLDDFGTGHASLALLRRLPLDKVKIDRSFVEAIDTPDGAAIVHAIVSVALARGLEVTAEGVQTREQQDFLAAAGVHYLQGYLYAEPLTAVEVARLSATC